MNIRISAIICTHNRAEYLGKAIGSLMAQTLPKEQYEVIVVDNMSSDGTREAVRRLEVRGERSEVRGQRSEEEPATSHLASMTYNLKYIYEPTLGLSQARNTGWKAATGEFVAYLDDDAIANPDWLQKIVEAFETIKPQPGAIGGKVEPVWEAPRPEWLSDSLLGQLAIVDWGEQPKFIAKEEWLAGVNIAYPRKVLEEIGGFSVKLGRIGSKLLSMEENLARIELEKKGYRCYYSPDIRVKHNIPASRMNKKWFLDRAYWNGASGAIVRIEEKRIGLISCFWQGLIELLRLVFCSSWLSPGDLRRKCSVYARLGHIFALWRIVK